MSPTIGRTVHCVLDDGTHRPGLVLEIVTETMVHVRVFTLGPVVDSRPEEFIAVLSQDEETKRPGTWHWPERVGEA